MDKKKVTVNTGNGANELISFCCNSTTQRMETIKIIIDKHGINIIFHGRLMCPHKVFYSRKIVGFVQSILAI